MVFVWRDYEPVAYGTIVLPQWAQTVGWTLSFTSIVAIPMVMLYEMLSHSGSLAQRVQDLLSPEDDWGPALAVHRAEEFPLQVPEARRAPKTVDTPLQRASLEPIDEMHSQVDALSSVDHATDRETAI